MGKLVKKQMNISSKKAYDIIRYAQLLVPSLVMKEVIDKIVDEILKKKNDTMKENKPHYDQGYRNGR